MQQNNQSANNHFGKIEKEVVINRLSQRLSQPRLSGLASRVPKGQRTRDQATLDFL
jgi:hypothetical protein